MDSDTNTSLNIAMLVIASCERQCYCDMIMKYWVPYITFLNQNTNIKVLLLFSKEEKNEKMIQHLNNIELTDNIRTYDVLETGKVGQPGCLEKTVFAFEEIYNSNKYDFVLRTNLSTVFLYDRLIHFLNKYDPTDKLALGGISDYCSSGTGYIYTMPLLKCLLEHKDKILSDRNKIRPDDLATWGITKRFCRRFKIVNFKSYPIRIPDRLDPGIKIEDYIKSNYDKLLGDDYNFIYIRLKNKKRQYDVLCQQYFIREYLKIDS